MPVEIIGEVGTTGATRGWIDAECHLAIKHVKNVCGYDRTNGYGRRPFPWNLNVLKKSILEDSCHLTSATVTEEPSPLTPPD
jgi:hypothetical protein